MRKQYFTPLPCHYAECTIYPQRCYDKQTSSLFARYNLRFVIRFNIELRPFTSSSSQSLYLRYYQSTMMRMLMSVSLYQSAVPTSFPRQIWPETHIARQRFVPSVRLDLHGFLENGFLHLWGHGFAQTWYMRICARLLIQKLESNQSKSANCSKFRPCEHETAIFFLQFCSRLSNSLRFFLGVSQTLK